MLIQFLLCLIDELVGVEALYINWVTYQLFVEGFLINGVWSLPLGYASRYVFILALDRGLGLTSPEPVPSALNTALVGQVDNQEAKDKDASKGEQ